MNKSLIILVFVAAAVLVCCASSPYRQCKGENFDDLQNRIKVNPCGKKKCNLKKEHNTTVEFRFTPKEKVEELINDVSASFGPVALPFPGVAGASACPDVRRADTGEAAPCPLEPGVDYVYKNTFYIYPFYPSADIIVHWSLNSGDHSVICFDVPAAIV